MPDWSGQCPKCGKDNVPPHSDHFAVKNAQKYSKSHPFVTGALSALYGAKRVGLIPTKCQGCGTTYWIGGRIS